MYIVMPCVKICFITLEISHSLNTLLFDSRNKMKSKKYNSKIYSINRRNKDKIYTHYTDNRSSHWLGIDTSHVLHIQITTRFPGLMGTNCAPLLADLFLYSYESEFLQNVQKIRR
jgi:hypothetical protein